MKLKNIIYLFVILILISCNLKNGRKTKPEYYQFVETGSFGIRTKPILNREYLIFLSWYMDVYGRQKVLQILPKESIDSTIVLKGEYNKLATHSSPILKDYILNPKYLNYPVLGLTIEQVMEFEAWLSDRYNENILMKVNYLTFNPDQMDEDCFVLESFLVGQYEGSVMSDYRLLWEDNKYVPCFRLPYKEEVDFLNKNYPNNEVIRAYKFDKKDFLWKWDEWYFGKKRKRRDWVYGEYLAIKTNQNKEFKFKYDVYHDELLTDKSREFVNTKYINLDSLIRPVKEPYPFPMKGKYGHMNFVIIGNDSIGKPIISDRMSFDEIKASVNNKVYRIAYNKTIDAQYLPKTSQE